MAVGDGEEMRKRRRFRSLRLPWKRGLRDNGGNQAQSDCETVRAGQLQVTKLWKGQGPRHYFLQPQAELSSSFSTCHFRTFTRLTKVRDHIRIYLTRERLVLW